MSGTVGYGSQMITELFNGTIASIENVIPHSFTMGELNLIEDSLQLQFGVLIGVTGDVKGKLVFSGESSVFSFIGESMFGMPLEGEMLNSFSGELGNMIAGGFATNIVNKGIKTDITAPTVMEGDTKVSGFRNAFEANLTFENEEEMNVYLLLD
ncbi:hypothetical protein GCM10008967_05040 [Bacillus carboniphilus]|uniref:Chemotaxis phosphatase CheX-like domain-containing protein n=1 Tax=Bacillus carboniphilus TaxID=86663 RepID=A0ABP3FIC3_9BACI